MEIPELSAVEIAARVRSGSLLAVGVVAAHLARIDEHDARLGAFQAVHRADALGAAAAIDALADRDHLPLAGVPVTIKDNIDVAGYPTRHGSAATSDKPAVADDELVRRLRAAGAIVVGKTRLSELAIWGFTQGALGVTRNPLDPDFDPGGSTGGGAVAVAIGMAAAALGTDGGGSLRIPAAYCGLVAIKPGRGLVPLPGGAPEHWFGLTETGPLARTAADAALLLDVLAGGVPAAPPAERPRVAVSFRNVSLLARVDSLNRAAVEQARERLEDADVEVTDAEPPYPLAVGQTWTFRWHAGIAREAAELGLDVRQLERRTATIVAKGRRVLRRGGPKRRAGERWRSKAISWLADYDAMLSPAVAGPAPLAGAWVSSGYLSTWAMSAQTVPYTQPWNLAGLPALTVPVLVDGVPHGVQLVGRPGAERTLLDLAARIEQRS